MDVGENWAYRPTRRGLHLDEVVVRKIGQTTRVQVAFIAEDHEGKVEWVERRCLESPWAQRENYLESLTVSMAVERAPRPSTHEREAADLVRIFVPHANLIHLYARGMSQIDEIGEVLDRSGLKIEDLTAWPCIEGDGTLTVTWATAQCILEALTAKCPDALLDYLDKREREAREEAVFGYHGPAIWDKKKWLDIPGEQLAASFAEHEEPVHALLRQWIGAEESTYRLDLRQAREELSRVGDIAQRAIRDLRQLRSNRTAAALESELLDPYRRARWPGIPPQSFEASGLASPGLSN